MPTIYGAVDIVKNELRNAVMQNLGTAPASPVKGLMYFNSTDNTFYWYDGTAWQAAKGGTPINPATTVTTQAIGDAPVVGTLTTYAREDHKHGEPGFGAITTEQTFGVAGAHGSAATIARSDHVRQHERPAASEPRRADPRHGRSDQDLRRQRDQRPLVEGRGAGRLDGQYRGGDGGPHRRGRRDGRD